MELERSDSFRPEATTLRRFVHTLLAERLAHRDALAARERDVSVLFADVGDYGWLAQSRAACEIYAFLSTYTGLVSQIVHDRGGILVDSEDQGTFAIFGAIESGPGKEEAALTAAREIVGSVARMGFSVAVGVATGDAAFDLMLPAPDFPRSKAASATTLALGLQELSGSLQAAVVADERTIRAAEEASDFERHDGIEVPGCTAPGPLYALPRFPKPA